MMERVLFRLRGLTPKKALAWLLINIPVLALSVSCIFPVVWLVYSSLKSKQDFALSPLALPSELYWENYVEAFTQASFDVFLFNSVFNSLVSLVVVIVFSFVLGYFFSRYRFPGRKILYVLLMAGIMIPVHALMVPVFIQFKNLGFLNTRFTLIPPYVAFELPISVFLIDSYLKGITVDMEEAASIDGAGTLRTMFGIMLPICKPVLSTVTILTFMHVWNEFPFAQILMTTKAMKTIPVGLTYFTSDHSVNYPLLMAALAIATVPVVLVYVAFHEKVMSGMMAGAVKG